MRVCTAKQMNQADRYAIEVLGISGRQLMFRAAQGIYEEMRQSLDDLTQKKLVILAGSGNNGGDGYALAGLACQAGMLVSVIRIDEHNLSPDAHDYAQRLADIPLFFYDQEPEACQHKIAEADIIVDAMYGTGFHGALLGAAAACAALANQASALRLSADLPSGVSCDTGAVDGQAFRAHVTVTFTAYKPCHFLYPSAEYCGRVSVCDIGIPDRVLQDGTMWVMSPEQIGALLPSRPRNSHKGTFGRLLVYCGSAHMTGAVSLCVGAALRSGVGLVEVAGPTSVIRAVAHHHQEPIFTHLASFPDAEGEGKTLLLAATRRAQAIACGCGLSLEDGQEDRVCALIGQSDLPMVLDADGITVLSRNIDILPRPVGDLVLTPHPREMARLTGKTVEEITANRVGIASGFAKQYGVTLVLKGANTVVAAPDGRVWFAPAACSGLAKGGSGDVLTGIIGSLLAQGLDGVSAAVAGVYIHARAGLLGSQCLTEYCLTPSQLSDFFPQVFREIKECN